MRLARKRRTFRLQHALSNILNGAPLKEWAEDITLQLLKNARQTVPPVNLWSKDLLKEKRIINIKYTPGLPERGRLAISDRGFVVEFSPTRQSSEPWHRFTLAHEIAHTFFYDLRNWPARHLAYLKPGDRDFEWFCNYLAKCLLIPAEWLHEQISHYPQLGSRDFSLRVVEHLGRTFCVPSQVVIERLVEDLRIWNCIFLQFIIRNEPSKSSQKERRYVWRLNWHKAPSEGTEGLYVPVGRREKNGAMRFPRAKGTMHQFIEDCIEEGQNTPFFYRTVSCQKLNTRATGNLGKFLHESLEIDNVPVYVAVRIPSERSLFDSSPISKPMSSIMLCFPCMKSKRVYI